MCENRCVVCAVQINFLGYSGAEAEGQKVHRRQYCVNFPHHRFFLGRRSSSVISIY